MRIHFLLPVLFITSIAFADEPLLDWAEWRKYRSTVAHPALSIKPFDLARAKENIRRYAWAQKYFRETVRKADGHLTRISPEFLTGMLGVTTPLSSLFTPCPACREMGKVWHPHGQYRWEIEKPDEIVCAVCSTVFPNEKYAESVVLKTTWGTPQTFGFYGGETFEVFKWGNGRPSFTGVIRARKVAYMMEAVRLLGEAYLLSGDAKYAIGARAILLRMAEVYPNWLVHSGYGEFADMDPRVAALGISDLPEDEVVYAPNAPDRKLHTGYWTAGRAMGAGQESHWVKAVALAYDFTCEAKDAEGLAIYSDAERLRIEEKLLLEGTILLVADKGINNKSVGNRAAVAMVGIALGHPGLTRFGLEGFEKTVDEWFLPDGGTPESPSYALMTFSNTVDLPLIFRGYSDPPGYRDASGKRLENVDLWHGTNYERAWAVWIDGLRADLTFAPYADSAAVQRIDAKWAELLAAHYPKEERYFALLREFCGADLGKADTPTSLYYREPDLHHRVAPRFSLPDFCPPDLRIGHMRTGAKGRESLLLLSASHWGVHHHLDSLNLSYWKNGHELLSDLGYLWDNPQRAMTLRTFAHNTVLIDEADQQKEDRGGEVHFFKTSEHVKVMRASSNAYAGAKRYERTSAIIEHGEGRNYVVDFFFVEGGGTQDYVFHGPNNDLLAKEVSWEGSDGKLYDLKKVRTTDGSGAWKLSWAMDKATQFSAWNVGQNGERAFIGDGWGQRNARNTDLGATLPYIVRRTSGTGEKCFVSVFEGHPRGKPFVLNVTRKEIPGGVMLEVETAMSNDHVVCERDFSVTSQTGAHTNWTFRHAASK